jgi:hypothetical protein
MFHFLLDSRSTGSINRREKKEQVGFIQSIMHRIMYHALFEIKLA